MDTHATSKRNRLGHMEMRKYDPAEFEKVWGQKMGKRVRKGWRWEFQRVLHGKRKDFERKDMEGLFLGQNNLIKGKGSNFE